MVIYFSGTGNSRFIAQKLAELTGDSLTDMGEYIKAGKYADFTDENYVFVSPVYVSAPPLAVMDFIKHSRFPEKSRAWFVMSCAGGMGGSPEYCRRISQEKGFDYMGTAQIVMPQNYIAFFKMRTKDECRAIIEKAVPDIHGLAAKLCDSKAFAPSQMKRWEYISTQMILKMYYRFFIKAKAFHLEGDCISCGRCAGVCPLGNIIMENGKPRWGENCTHCMACINLCPKNAIEYGKKTQGKMRYKGPGTV